jgi:hypothetical protein
MPALLGSGWSFDQRNALILAGGSLAEAGLLIYAVYLLRLMYRRRAT